MPPRALTDWRSEFPVLANSVYLRSNAMGAVPRGLEQALDRYTRLLFEQGDDAWQQWFPGYLQAMGDRLASLVGAPAGSVTTGGSVTEFEHKIASALDFAGQRSKVIVSALDFPSVRYAWQAWERYGAQVVVIPSRDGGVTFELDEVLGAIDAQTAVVALSLATYGSGFVPEILAVARKARDMGALTVIDAFQAFGVMPIDVQALDIDILVSGTRKFAMGSGEAAFMYVRPDLCATLEPALVGWIGHEAPFAFDPGFTYARGPRRFQGGTPLVLPLHAAEAGLEILSQVGLDRIREASLLLTDRLIAHADRMGIAVGTPREHARRGGVVALRFEGAEQATQALNSRRFFCSHRPGCGLRVAPHFYNTAEEIDRFMEALGAFLAGQSIEMAAPA